MSNVLTQIAFNPLVLGDLCLAHLAREEDLLRKIMGVLDQIPQLLKPGTQLDSSLILQHQEEVEYHSQEVKKQRQQFQKLLAHHLNIPQDQANVSALLEYLPPKLNHQVMEKRKSLQDLSAQVQRENQKCTVLIQMCADFYQSIFNDLTGHVPSQCYNAQGMMQAAVPSPIFKNRG